MDGGRAVATAVVLLWLFAGEPAGGVDAPDVCSSCHVNATCDDKADGAGKVCNCKYGFVGNGRSFCQDKDECQIGANRICGQLTTCHNTYGSYFCTCLAGYTPSNNMAVFIPNDGTHCQDIDECGVSGVCGPGARCRNLDGGFDCSCRVGYKVHDGVEPFQPARDGTTCRVVDCGPPGPVEGAVLQELTGTAFGSEARFVCDDGLVWRRGDGRSACGADGRWRRPSIVCEEVDCGAPPALPHSHLLWNGSSGVGAEALYRCRPGYRNVGGGNVSVCTGAGRWEAPPLLCQEISCGDPPVIRSTERLWDNDTAPGSTARYVCKHGFKNTGGTNLSSCNDRGQWTLPTLSCREVSCGAPPVLPHTGQVWDGRSTPGSSLAYFCRAGFSQSGGGNVSVCSAGGRWTLSDITCREITCGPPVTLPNTNLLWDERGTAGSVALYQCVDGFYQDSGNNVSTCSLSGEWGGVSVTCKAKCGPVPAPANSEVLWHNRSVALHGCVEGYYSWTGGSVSVCGDSGVWQEATLICKAECGSIPAPANSEVLWHNRSVALHGCVEGYYSWTGGSVSVCGDSGVWQEATLICKAECGPIPALENSQVLWHNSSVVMYRCVEGYHSWRGSNVSVCNSAGQWQEATLRCIEIKPPVTRLSIFNEKCLRWNAEKYEEDTEIYQVVYTGSRDYQSWFRDKRRKRLASKDDRLELCLDLLPLTNYSVSVTATSARFTAAITTNTSLPVPPAPLVSYQEFENPSPTLRLRRPPSTLDSLSLYQVFVVPVEDIVTFDCSSPPTSDPRQYITAQLHLRHVRTEMNFTVGDGRLHGGIYNAPLGRGKDYYIILRALCQWKTNLKSSCVLWAKVRGTSYILKISSLCAAVFVALLTLLVLGGYSFIWCVKKTRQI